jgi:thioredoxin reductase (NADPH)
VARAPLGGAVQGLWVSACATCDGFFYKGQEIVVVGGGNTAVEEALFLTNFATKVTLVHRRDTLRAEKIMQERLFRHPKIEVIWNHEVEEVLGEQGVTGVRLRDVHSRRHASGPRHRLLRGHRPCARLRARPGPARAAQRRLREGRAGQHHHQRPGRLRGRATSPTTSTVRPSRAPGMGCMAALDAERWLAAQPMSHVARP